jgi:transcriptional regulator with XRE-family HTH domain
LRGLRSARGWTAEQVAERLEFSPSKVSRLENGLRGVSARDIRDLCDLYDVRGERRQQLIDLAAEGKQRAWWQSRDLPYSNYVGLEAAATSIRDFGLGVVPGLLQTPDYARAVLSARQPQLSADAVEQRVGGRIERQRVLDATDAPQFTALIDEAVLHRPAGSRAIMKAQLEHLLTVSERPLVTIRVLPFDAGLLPVGTSKFIILSFANSKAPGVVFVEVHTGDLYLGPDDGLAAYEEAFGAMKGMAAAEADSQALIASLAAEM